MYYLLRSSRIIYSRVLFVLFLFVHGANSIVIAWSNGAAILCWRQTRWRQRRDLKKIKKEEEQELYGNLKKKKPHFVRMSFFFYRVRVIKKIFLFLTLFSLYSLNTEWNQLRSAGKKKKETQHSWNLIILDVTIFFFFQPVSQAVKEENNKERAIVPLLYWALIVSNYERGEQLKIERPQKRKEKGNREKERKGSNGWNISGRHLNDIHKFIVRFPFTTTDSPHPGRDRELLHIIFISSIDVKWIHSSICVCECVITQSEENPSF